MKNKLNIVLLGLVVAIIGCSDTTQTSDAYINYSSLVIGESAANDGTFAGTIEIETVGVEFSDTLTLDDDYEFSNVPDGITLTVVRVDDNNATVAVSGQVVGHGRCDFQAAGLSFLGSAFSSGNRPENANVLFNLAFRPASATSYNGTYVEAGAGGVDNSDRATLTLGSAGYFSFAGQLTQGVHYSITEVGSTEDGGESPVPAGIIEVLTVLPGQQVLEVTFGGATDPHLAENSFAFAIKFLETNLEEDEITVSPFSANTFCVGQTPSLNIAVNFAD